MKRSLPATLGTFKVLFPLSLFLTLCFCIPVSLFAQTGAASKGFWQEMKDSDVAAENTVRLIVPSKYLAQRLDLAAMKSALLTAPKENTSNNNGIEMHFPMPDGTFGRFKVWYSPIMAPELAAKYPEIRTYGGYDMDNPARAIRLDVTPAGFHAMTYGGGAAMFIDPYAQGSTQEYICYYKRDFVKKVGDQISCLVSDDFSITVDDKNSAPDFVGDCGIRHEYRLAVAATGEYTIFHGGTVALAQAAIVTTMNRVNGVFERDCAVRMILIGNNTDIVYVNPATDPYTNGNPGLMINENQTNIDNVIGNGNYDIGHVFGTDSGGLAGLGVVCNNTQKAKGVTGSGAPIGDPFDIDYVAHEIGHQFKANHTQYNDSCNRNNGTAVEPGSGATIMGYAGVCSPSIQPNSDDYFSTASIFEMRPFIATGGGSGCDVEVSVPNTAPSVTALSNYSIPKSTPFVLTASATDPDGSLTYCWEQIDTWTNPTQPMPPTAGNLHGPVFRSLDPVASNKRYFPNLTDLFNNVTPTWEVLPSIGRTMDFRVTVRDNVATAGCTGEASHTVTTVAAAGPFLVTSPNTAVVYPVGSNQTVTWDVANTTAAPVSCANVDIMFTSDGGATFTTLLANTPNDGSQVVTMPGTATATARIVVKCSNNIFFDVSNVNFKLVGPLVINEVDYDQAGTDAAEFLELKNISGSAVNLNGWTVELVNGSGGGAAIYSTISLPNVNLAAGDYFVICANAANTPNCDLDVTPNTDLIQNGAPDGIGLRNNGVLVDAVSYEGNTGAPYTETSGTGLIDGAGAANQGISRFPDGTDTDVNNVDLLSNVCITPGLANVNTTAGCILPCNILSIAFSNVGSCNNNGTPLNPSDDYFLADITVTFELTPSSEDLVLSGDVLAGGGPLMVAAPAASPYTFIGVRLKADGTASVVTATLGNNSCSLTNSNGPNVASCSNGSPIVINEVDYDQAGTDAAEFLELKNVSGAAVNLNGWTVELVNGSVGGAAIYNTIVLPNVSLAAGDYFVICANAANTPNCDLDVTPNTDLIQNGAPDAIGLRNASGTLMDAVSYEGNTGAPYTETSGTGLIDGAGAANQGISRFPDGADTDVNNVDLLSNVCITPGAANVNTTQGCVLPCGISAITFTNVGSCNNNGTPTIPADDYFIADVTVVFANPPATGNLTLSGDVLVGGGALSVMSPFTSPTVFVGIRLKADGTPSVVTATFSDDQGCTFTVNDGPTVASCSAPICGITVTCPPQPVGIYDCNNPIPPPATTEAEFEALGGDISGVICGVLVINSSTTPVNNCSSTAITRTYTIWDDYDPTNGVVDGDEVASTCVLTYTYSPDNTPPTFNEFPLPANIAISCTDDLPIAPMLTGSDNCAGIGSVPDVIWINEFHYDNTGGDVGEFVEVAGTAGLDLSDYQIILYNGNGGAVYDTDLLAGFIDDEGSGFGAVALFYPANGIQNGAPDGIALYQVSTNMVLQFLSYEGVFQANGGPADGMFSTDVGVLEPGTDPIGLSLQLTGTGQVAADFTWVGPLAESPGTLNAGQTINPLPASIPAVAMQTEAPGNCAGSRIVTRTWTLTDACNLQTVHTQIITLEDTQMPMLTPMPADTTINCDVPVPPVPVVVGTDDCDPAGMVNGPVWINEIHYDNVGNDVNEFIEIAGRAGTNLSTYELYLYNGSTGMMGGTYDNLPLSGIIPDQSNGFGTIAFFFPPNGIQNGPSDGIAFVNGATVIQFLSYEGVMTAIGGPANGMVSTDIGVAEPGSDPIGQSLRLSGNGAMYSSFVWNNPSAANPATPGAVNQGQTFPVQPPVGLPVTFNEVTSPPSPNCPDAYTITRTWTTTDACSNTAIYTQTITVQDTTAPVLNCPAGITVNLDVFGNYVLNSSDINFSATDNCSSSSEIVAVPSSATYDCDDAGTTVPFTLTVRDACGNTASCVVQVTIAQFERCTPVILISDPCVCKNNATTLTNGQFGETIKIESLAGKTWTLIANTGLYLAGSPAPPSAPILIPIGTTFTENPVPSGDYYLDGIHVDALGYSITVQSESGEILEIGNSCEYPNPTILSVLSGDFCLFSDIVPLVGDPGDANIISEGFTVNGVPATEFDPSQGLGQYVIVYTVDGGVPKAFGPNDPGCIQSVKVFVNVIMTPATLNCNDQIYVSLPASCTGEIMPDDVLEGTYGCYDDYIVELDKTAPFGNGPWLPATLTAADFGKTYQTRVTHLVSGNKCWGLVTIEDKLAPVMTCEAIHLICPITNYSPAYLANTLGIAAANPVVTDCSDVTLTHVDTWFDLACGASINGMNDISAYVTRKWTATDAWGNSTTCLQYLYFDRKHVSDVIFPADYEVSCSGNLNADPSVTGAPYLTAFGINWPLFPGAGFCEMQSAYVDQILPVCDGTYKILRTWTLLDWCLPTSPNPPYNPMYYIQLIKVVDETGPVMTCPPNTTVSIDPFACCATVDMPDLIIEDACSRINNISGMVALFDPFTGAQTGMETFGGTLTDFPGNNYWDRDTMARWGFTPCLPIGTQVVTYSAQDDCSNVSTCTFRLVVQDLIPPVAACDQFTQVALGSSGEALVNASTFNDGSYDQCCLKGFTAGKMGGGLGATVYFDCNDIGDTITVVFRVEDCSGNTNDCMVSVVVVDKIKPVCQSPANVTVSCEQFDPSLWVYGIASIYDNCCLDDTKEYQGQEGLTHTVSYSNFDTLCNKGTITRTFRAFDCYGNSSQCTQRIVVNYEQDYFVKFPNDVIVSVCDGTGNYGEPSFFGEDCELLGVSFEDEIFTVVPDACFKIERTWKIINWCTYDPNLPCINVPNPNPHATANHPTNLPGPTVSPIQTNGDPWKSTIVKITPTASSTNYSIFYDPNANCYVYKQIIKIIDTEDPIIDCPASPVTICDLTPNDPLLWNASYWWDNNNQSHDLCEAPSDICITATDLCSGANINIEYQLFLDLDGDGIMETVVNSTQLGNQPGGLGWNNILFGNFTGVGQPRQFDFRPVSGTQKWGFAIEETVTGNNKTACVKFNTQGSQSTFVTPQLPHGTHKIKWFVSDGCGNDSVCEYTIIIKDCKAPTVVCLNGLSVNIMPTGMIQLWATDFLQYTEDNCTQTQFLKLGIRKSADMGTGFPVDAQGNPITNVTFDCTELGLQQVELWSIDLAGNADYCETYVLVQDNNGNCMIGSSVNVSGALKTEMAEGVEEADVSIQNMMVPTGSDGLYHLNNIPVGSAVTITPAKDDNPLNGVTTYDLVLISKHILGIEPLGSPYKMIAADANKSNSITTFDIVELRKLILGIYQELPNNSSWRFVDKAQQFANPSNPFAEIIHENISIGQAVSNLMDEDFVGVKIGDVNNTVVANSLMVSDDRSVGTLLFDVNDRDLKAGEEFEVSFKASEKTQGYQMTLNLSGLEVAEIVESDKVSVNNFGVIGDVLTVSIDGAESFTVKFRAAKSGKLSEMLQVSSRITKAEGYSMTDGRMDVALRFDGKTIAGVGFELYQNQPNPFVNKTMIGFSLPSAATATLTVYDETGRVVFTQKGDFAKGYNAISLDRALLNTTGVLYYTLETATDAATMKMIQAR